MGSRARQRGGRAAQPAVTGASLQWGAVAKGLCHVGASMQHAHGVPSIELRRSTHQRLDMGRSYTCVQTRSFARAAAATPPRRVLLVDAALLLVLVAALDIPAPDVLPLALWHSALAYGPPQPCRAAHSCTYAAVVVVPDLVHGRVEAPATASALCAAGPARGGGRVRIHLEGEAGAEHYCQHGVVLPEDGAAGRGGRGGGGRVSAHGARPAVSGARSRVRDLPVNLAAERLRGAALARAVDGDSAGRRGASPWLYWCAIELVRGDWGVVWAAALANGGGTVVRGWERGAKRRCRGNSRMTEAREALPRR